MLTQDRNAIIVCGDSVRSSYWYLDCSAAAQNILLAAESLGLGAVSVSYTHLDVYKRQGLCGLSVFVGSLLTNGWGGPQSCQIAMTNCCAVARCV